MDLRFSPDEIAFRSEVRAFFNTEVPESIRRKVKEGRGLSKADWVTSHKILHAKGWATPHWPREWGGTGWGPILTYIFNEELQSAGVPQPLPFNVAMCGPVLMQFGTEAQKQVPPTDGGARRLVVPGLLGAGRRLRPCRAQDHARREGDHYIVNGQKTWTTSAQYANWIFPAGSHRP